MLEGGRRQHLGATSFLFSGLDLALGSAWLGLTPALSVQRRLGRRGGDGHVFPLRFPQSGVTGNPDPHEGPEGGPCRHPSLLPWHQRGMRPPGARDVTRPRATALGHGAPWEGVHQRKGFLGSTLARPREGQR